MNGTAWRLTRRDHADLSGQGGLVCDGRWHTAGRRVTYAADTPSLAVLEVLVHFDLTAAMFYEGFVMLRICWPASVQQRTLDAAELPDGWNTAAGERPCRPFGDAWLGSAETPILVVPSAIVPLQRNVIINPAHPAATAIGIADCAAFTFDKRLLRSA